MVTLLYIASISGMVALVSFFLATWEWEKRKQKGELGQRGSSLTEGESRVTCFFPQFGLIFFPEGLPWCDIVILSIGWTALLAFEGAVLLLVLLEIYGSFQVLL